MEGHSRAFFLSALRRNEGLHCFSRCAPIRRPTSDLWITSIMLTTEIKAHGLQKQQSELYEWFYLVLNADSVFIRTTFECQLVIFFLLLFGGVTLALCQK